MALRLGRCAPVGALVVLMSLALVAGLLSAVPLRAGAAPPALQPYADPDKQFTIEYPQGWHVKCVPAGGTYFYLDDPEEGSSFNFTPAGAFKGEMDAGQALKVLVAAIRKKYPDFKVVGQKQRPMQANPNGTIVRGLDECEERSHEGMGSLGVIKQVGRGRTLPWGPTKAGIRRHNQPSNSGRGSEYSSSWP